jgi:hypothetical protein
LLQRLQKEKTSKADELGAEKRLQLRIGDAYDAGHSGTQMNLSQ